MIKHLFLTLLIACSTQISLAQKTDSLKNKLQPVRKVGDKENISLREGRKYDVYGDFTVKSYQLIGTKTQNKKSYELMLGSLIKIKSTNLTGELIDPMTYETYETETMSKEDYLYRQFGAEAIHSAVDLPSHVQVYKIDAENCYGIINLGADGVAFAYKGALIFLERK